MSSQEKAVDTTDADKITQKKQAHDYIATAVQILTTRVQFYHEEFLGVQQSVEFLRAFRDQIAADIKALEPATETVEAPAKPYHMDLSHVKAEPKAAE